ncbi:hypothetical protein R1sor_003303 [Riccia sorocarpa]|uniref:MULE transposase domain-containing protein n=1 Tax=Riccia sorocarpa TaxID=122646 RepID=A0ABD3H2V0_9MARC
MRERAVAETTPIPQIYQEEANRLASSEAASAMLPVLQSIDTALYRARRQCLPPLPDDRADIVVPESLRFTEAGESFVLLQMLNNDIMVPLLYVLMGSKERAAYVSLFRGLKDLAVTRGHRFSPQFILSDFESGLIPAIRDEFPHVHHQGCYFHLIQALWRKVQQLGMVQYYTHNNPVKDAVRRVMALGFLPIEEVHLGLELIRLSLTDLDRMIMGDFLEYFQRQWCEAIPIGMWNVHGMQRRTNNNCEGWHHKFNQSIRHHHPNIWELIERLRSEQCTSVRERLQIGAGQ